MIFEWFKLIGGIIGAIYLFRYWVMKNPVLDFLKGDLSAWILKYGTTTEGLIACFVVGIIVTAIAHSSSVVMWALIPLVSTNLVHPFAGIAIILGANIGTCIDGFIASGAFWSENALKIASAHLMFNVLGNTIMFPLFLLFRKYLI